MNEEKPAPTSGSEPVEPKSDAVVVPQAPSETTPTTDQSPPAPAGDSFYQPETPGEPSLEPLPESTEPSSDEEAITWTASEFIAHNKSFLWYVGIICGTLVIAALVFVLTHDVVPAAVIFVLGIALCIYGAHPPRQLEYTMNYKGLQIADKFYPFDNFRAFAVLEDGAFSSIVFAPLKRFGQLLTIYFDPADEERIVNLLSNSLPLEQRSHDPIDQLLKRIHF